VTLIDPVQVAVQALKAKGWDVHPEDESEAANISKSALSSAAYVWVEEVPSGQTPHIRYSDRPTIQVVVYSNVGILEATRLGRKISTDLLDSVGIPFLSGGIHRVLTLIRPSRQDLPGLPPGVGRTVAQYELVLSTEEKWS
jgi:hypothetical protein